MFRVEAFSAMIFGKSVDPEVRLSEQERLEAQFLKALPTSKKWDQSHEGYDCLLLRGGLLTLFKRLKDFQSGVLDPYTEVQIGDKIWLRRETNGERTKF